MNTVEDKQKICPNCNGTGQVRVTSYIRGEVVLKPCPRCQKIKEELKCKKCSLLFTETEEEHTCGHCKEVFCVLHREPEKHNCPKYKLPLKIKLKKSYYTYIYSFHMKALRASKPLLKYSTLAFLLLALFQPQVLIDNSPVQIGPLIQSIGSIKDIVIAFIKGIVGIAGSILGGLSFSGDSDTEYIPTETRQLMTSLPKPEYDNPYLIELIGMITKDCQGQDSACKTFMIHRYVQENFDYVYIPTKSHLNPAPETIKNKYGVCIDFAILYYNYLMAANVESYIVDSYGDNHAYAVACDLDLKRIEDMWLDVSRKWRVQYIIDNKATFEINRIWDKSCVHLEGPPSEKDQYYIDVSYPGEYTEYFIDPETGAESPLGKNRYAIDPKAERATLVTEILLVGSSWKGFERKTETSPPTTTRVITVAPERRGEYATISFYDSAAGEYLDGEVYLEYSLYGETKNGEIKLYLDDIPEKEQLSKYIEPRITIGFKGLKGSNMVKVEWYFTKTELISSDHKLEL